jgi:hypothetical protein
MLNRFKKIILFLAFALPIICPATSFAWHGYTYYGDWDYYGSGRDHPYSAYIDRANYVGPADYASIAAEYIDGPLVISSVIAPPPDEFTVNIPNTHGGYNAVVIKRSGDGFIGPQGEYYPEFPKVFQLQMKYGQ